ncbi:hypothetical protein FIBSPDRAFT_879029 [Athelia psychrophila]|uniref:HCP-like protein n=1 Tax=Athelia psychrophila TaxID=1759441 RepID=A0A167UF61_9AGAM|nr:hypothetical protein FIBSPDRAFT_879029 [Fibularhizoctonia sp. CBS 109695]
MASLLGQFGIQPSPAAALPHLARADALATTRVPQPAYVYARLLLNEFTQVSVDPREFAGYTSRRGDAEARKHLERAVFLNFAPAQYKLGHCYEFAQPRPSPSTPSSPCRCVPQDEDLVYTFAEKAAVRGLGSAEFAMGYYAEVGVGPVKDVEAARAWYTKAAEHGNTDANDRLVALGAPGNAPLSRQQHDDITETNGERDRPPSDRQGVDGRRIVENVRRGSMDQRPGPGPPAGAPMAPIAESPRMRPQQLPQQQGGYPQQPPAGQQHNAHLNRPTLHHPASSARLSSSTPHRPASSAPLRRQGSNARSQARIATPRRLARAQSPAWSETEPRTITSTCPARTRRAGWSGERTGRPAGTACEFDAAAATAGGLSRAAASATHAIQQQPPRKQGVTTFAEMGITAAKAEDKECVIM